MQTTDASGLIQNNALGSTVYPSCLQEQVQQQQLIHQLQVHAQVHMSQTHGSSSQYQRLKVEDALTYLDQVKYTFANQPEIYNDFLDVMKEFKSQSIDTSGVIQCVSSLFKDHPKLIVGFNTFLPPGYKIELQPNDHISVIFPNLSKSSFHLSSVKIFQSKTNENHINKNNDSQTENISLSSTESVIKDFEIDKIIKEEQNLPMHIETSNTDKTENILDTINTAVEDNQPPVEFNHAVNYVNKIKRRFQSQPDVYKRFLEILNTYQNKQNNLKEGVQCNINLTESEIYSQVANIFQNQSDLLDEFAQFLPETTNSLLASINDSINDHSSSNDIDNTMKSSTDISEEGLPIKRTITVSPVPAKKLKKINHRFSSFSEIGKYGTLKEFSFFDKVRKALRNQEVYENFLRCIVLYNQEVVSRHELIYLVTPFLGKFPDLIKWFKDLLGYKESDNNIEIIPNKVALKEYQRVASDRAMEIDYSSCKKCGASYRALPKNYVQPKCSGRTNLCKEVLNDTWVSFPSWSEDSTFVSSRKTQFEEYIYRCEDERFELDVVVETNLSTIRALEAVLKKLARMPQDEKSKFRLDDTLGGTSTVTHYRAIKRIYGDKSTDIIEGLKKNPVVAVPLVLRRLKAKEEEWREAQKNFNKIWREQNEKYYLKSLDHQGITFKQNDTKFLRSKSLLNEIETICEERHEQVEEGGEITPGPHMTLIYKTKMIMSDVSNLIIHNMKRQNGIHKDDKRKIKLLLREFIPEFFGLPHEDITDDEMEKGGDNEENKNSDKKNTNISNNVSSKSSNVDTCKQINEKSNCNSTNECPVSNEQLNECNDKDVESDTENENTLESSFTKHLMNESNKVILNESYKLFFANNNWYLFFRLYHILCERLGKIYECATTMLTEESKENKEKKESIAVTLQFKPKNNISKEECYPAFIEMIKNFLDGNIECTQFEDTLREIFGIHAYVIFTVDKVVQNLTRQLQHIVSDEFCMKYVELHHELRKNGMSVNSYNTMACQIAAENLYQKKAEQIQSDENCFKIILWIEDCRMTIELIDTETDTSEDPIEISQWSEYIDDYVIGKVPTSPLNKQVKKFCKGGKVFLFRNIKKWRPLFQKQDKVNNTERIISFSPHENYTEKVTNNNDDDEDSPDVSLINSKPLSPMESARQKAMEDMEILDNTECKFNVNSYKMVFVVHSESYLYRKKSLKRAHQLYEKIKEKSSKKFELWHKSWEKKYVSAEMQKIYLLKFCGNGNNITGM